MGQTVHADTVGAASLALGLLHIDPAVVMSLLEQSLIPLSQRGQPFLDNAEGFFIVHADLGILHQRGVDVVHMERPIAQDLFAVTEVPVEQGQTLFDTPQEVLIHLHIHILGGQRPLQAGGILPGAGHEHILVHTAYINGGDGIAQPNVCLVQAAFRTLRSGD